MDTVIVGRCRSETIGSHTFLILSIYPTLLSLVVFDTLRCLITLDMSVKRDSTLDRYFFWNVTMYAGFASKGSRKDALAFCSAVAEYGCVAHCLAFIDTL
jgi:hypothetical protein